MSLPNFKLRFLHCDVKKPELKEYEIILDGTPAGALAFFNSEGIAHVYNVYLDEEWRGNGIFRTWLTDTFEGVVAYDVLVKKEAYWASLGEYKLHPNDPVINFEDMVFIEGENYAC
jgi:hypothetical protein